MAINWDQMVLSPVMSVFGESATYLPAVGSPFAVTGVFDEAYRELELVDDMAAISTSMPVFGARLAEFPGPPKQGDKVFIQSVNATFVVREVRPDGHGGAKLMLNFASSP
ncbi:MAG: hypothetical protein F8N39_11630 [Clostridiaceae bacterium]|nr:hypothetical protein [Clostridiaceae bacterium]